MRFSTIATILIALMTVTMTCVAMAQSVESPAHDEGGPAVSGHFLSLDEVMGMMAGADAMTSASTVGMDHGTGAAPPSAESLLSMVGEYVIDSVEPTDTLPSYVDVSTEPYFPPIGDQGTQGSCTGWAVGYYAYGYMEAKDNGWSDAYTGNTAHLLSPAWVYSMANAGVDSGSWPDDVGSVIVDWGIPTMAKMPYDQNDYVSWGDADAFREAPLHRAAEVNSMVHDSGSVNDVKTLVSSGTPVTFLIYSGSLTSSVSGDFTVTAAEVDANKYTNHCQTIVGYNDSHTAGSDTGAFKVANSWGASWGSAGYYWLTYDAFDKIASVYSSNLDLTYMVDEADYDPSLLALWEFEGSPTRNGTMSVSIGSTSSPDVSKTPYFEPNYASDLRFPSFMCLDVTEFQDTYDAGSTTLNLKIEGNSQNGTMASFKVEAYDGYAVGAPDMVSGQSPGVKRLTPGTVSVSLMPYVNPGINDALDNPYLTFTHGVGPEWVPVMVEHNRGNSSMQSGMIAAGGSSSFTTTVVGPGVLSYDMMLSCAGGYTDNFIMSMDGTSVGTFSGVIPWTTYEVDIPSGAHLLRWEYVKDPSGIFGADCAWVDDVRFMRASSSIDIIGDVGLVSLAAINGWSGTGTGADPYVIHSLDVDAHSGENALRMENVSLHVRVEACRLHNATGAGIMLVGVGNITLTGNTIEDCGTSYILESTDPSMGGNVFSDTGGPGIEVLEPGNATNSGEVSWSISSAHEPGQTSYLVRIDLQSWVDVGTSTTRTFQLADGVHTVDVHGTDSSGNEYTTSHTFTMDSLDPTLEITVPMDGELFNETGVPLDWVDDGTGSTIDLREYRIDGGEWTIVDDPPLTFQMVDGHHTIDVRVWDEAGNSNTSSVTFMVDTTAPRLSLTVPGSPTNDHSPMVSWNAIDDVSGVAGYLIQVDHGEAIDVGSNTSIELDLADGEHWITVWAYDLAMNHGNLTVGLTVDTIAPEIWDLTPEDGATVDDSVFELTFEAADNGTGVDSACVTLDGGVTVPATHGDDGWSVTLSAAVGTHDLTVTVTDMAGNVNETELTVHVLDATPPSVVEAGPTGQGVPLGSTIAVKFSEPMEQGSVSIQTIHGVNVILGTTSWSNDTLTFIPDSLPIGATIEVTVTGDDVAGNPMVPFTWSFVTEETTSLTIEVRDGSDPVAGAEISIDGNVLGATDSDGTFVVIGLDPGDHTIVVSQDEMQESRTISLEDGSASTLDVTFDEGEDDPLWIWAALAIVAMSVLVVVLSILRRSKAD